MTKRDFFILIIKLFGLFSIVTSLFSFITSNLTLALMDLDEFTWAWVFFGVLVLIGFFILLIFKAGKIVDLLKLDRGFDNDKIELENQKSSEIIKVGLFIIGGLLIINNIPTFLTHTIYAFKGSIVGVIYNSSDKFNWAICGFNILLGFFLVTKYSFFTGLLSKKTKELE